MNGSIYGRTASGFIILALLISLLVQSAQAAGTVVFDATISGGATAAASVSTSAPVAAAAGKLYLAAVATKAGSVSVRSITGLGLAWALVKAQCAGRNQTRIELWQARGMPSQSGVVTAILSGAAANAAINVSRYSGVDAAAPVGALVSANTRGVAGSCSGGIDSNSYNVTLPVSAPGAVVFGAVAMRNRTHAPGSGYVERAELSQGSGGDMASLAIEDRSLASAGTVAVNGVFSGLVDWAMVAVEIRPGTGGEPTNRAPVAQNGQASTRQNTAVSVVLTATDPDGDPLTYRVVASAAHGSLAGAGANWTYTPSVAYTGADSFSFVANDGQIDSNIATISITITPPDAPTSTPTPTPTSTPTPTPGTPAHIGGLWISAAELARLPASGAAWDRMKAAADGDLGTPTLADYNANHDVKTLAVALVYGRTGEARYRQKAADAIRAAIGKEAGGLVIMVARNLVCYIISADLIDLKSYDPALDGQFRQWISAMRTKQFSDGTLISEHERRANNHGTMPGASRAAIAVYLGDAQELARTAQIFKGWVGDRTAYSGFKYPYDLTWQADPANPVAINPVGAMIQGHAVGGAMPEEMRRGCTFRWPPCQTGYPWEGLQGALVQANILARQGYDVWNWQDRALLRAVQFLQSLEQQYPGWWASSDDTWVPWFVNYAYGTNFPTSAANIGKNMGWTDWMYAR